MKRYHHMVKNINILNCLLLLAVAAAAYEVVPPFLNLKINMSLPAIRKVETVPAETPAAVHYPPPADFGLVSDQSLFHPERRIPLEKKADSASAVLTKPDLVLYGTLISDTTSIATIEDRKVPYSTTGRDRRQTQLKKGDTIAGYILQEIEQDRIVLVKGEEKMVVLLQDKGKIRAGDNATAGAGAPLSAATRTEASRAAISPPAGAAPPVQNIMLQPTRSRALSTMQSLNTTELKKSLQEGNKP
jgi:hypothetical protein